MPVPDLDPEERAAALARAAEVRRVRAELKQMLKTGEVTLRQVLDRAREADELAGMRVADVLAALPGHGKIRARRLMDELGIADGRRLRGLGAVQRRRLLDRLG